MAGRVRSTVARAGAAASALLLALASQHIAAALASQGPTTSRLRAEQCAHICDGNNLPTGKDGACEFNLITDTNYLPDPEFFECVREHGSKTFKNAKDAYMRYIEELQNPPDCSNRKRKWHVAALTDFGLGSVLAHQFTQTLVKAWASGLPVVMSNSAWRYADEDRKCGPGYSCMMRPLSHCKIEELQPSQVMLWGKRGCQTTPETIEVACGNHGAYNITDGRCHCDAHHGPHKCHGCTPFANMRQDCLSDLLKDREGVHTSTKRCWTLQAPGQILNGSPRGQVPRQLDAPSIETPSINKFLHPMVATYLLDNPRLNTSLPPKEGCIGVQIRHGDACNSKYKIANVLERTCFPVGVYVKQIKKLVGVYGERPVFLATDDPQVVKEMRQQLQAIGIELLHADIDRTKYDTTTVLDGRADISGRTVSEEILRDVWEMSNCDMLLGSFVSSPFLLAWRLAAGRKGYFPPFISLETAPGNPVLGGWSQYKPGQPLYGKTCRCTDNSRRNVCRCDVLLEEFRNAAVSEGH